MAELKEAALAYASRGIAVFPCEPQGKRPLGRFAHRGFHSATLSATDIEKWWDAEPDANIGVPTGPVSGWLVLDWDLYKDHAWDDYYQLIKALGPLPQTTEVSTPQGGQHFIYEWPDGLVHKSIVGRGLDIKGAGGYVVAPPSIGANGREYRVDLGIAPARLSQPWLELLVKGSFDPLKPAPVQPGLLP
jgi:hypothetical protein